MRTIHYVSNNPFFAEASFEGMLKDTLYFLEVTDYVFVGKNCPIPKWVNPKTKLPVVRGAVLGNSFLFDHGKNLWVAFSCKDDLCRESLLQEIIMETLKKLGIDTKLSSNDIIYGKKQLGMTAPTERYTNLLTAGVLNFGTNFKKINSSLIAPDYKWIDKPVKCEDDWLLGITDINGTTIDDFIETCKDVAEEKLKTVFKKGTFTPKELALMTELKANKYTQDYYLKYGKTTRPSEPDFK